MVSVPRLLSGVNVSASDVDVLKPACLDTLGSVRAAVQNNYTAILDEVSSRGGRTDRQMVVQVQVDGPTGRLINRLMDR